MNRKLAIIVAVTGGLAVSAAGIVSAAPGGGDGAATQAKKAETLDQDMLFIETNATDGDAALNVTLDGEDWTKLKIVDPRGRTLMNTANAGGLKAYGLTGMTLESSVPAFNKVPFEKFKKRFPEGKYKFSGETIKGRKLKGSHNFSHTIPDQPKITSPADGADVSAGGYKITWDPVTSPSGIDISNYFAIATVEAEKKAVRELEMLLPGDATSATIPGQFLEVGAETAFEIIAKAKNGNQTLTEQSVVVK